MVNWDRLSELREEVGEDDLAEVITLFCEEVEEVLALLDAASPADLPNHLHFLKGSALNIGFEAVSTRCQNEEARLKQNPNAAVDTAGIRTDYAASKAELDGLI
jgi:HPt (histidine-containing phosphotransfer) domain-containing protein